MPKAAPSDATMELILLPSLVGMMIMFAVQFMEFVHREPATELGATIRAIALNVAAVSIIHLAAIRYVFLPLGTV